MAALNRPTQATYEVHESVKVDTSDNEDHTFCGIIFPIKAKTVLPVEKIVIHSISVRGQLGPMTVWVSKRPGEDGNDNQTGTTAAAAARGNNNNGYNFALCRRQWTLIYQQTHAPSQRVYTQLDLRQQPIVLEPGEARAVYVHSTLDGDEAIVYDNSSVFRRGGQTQTRYEDSMIAIYSGRAHLSPVPFGQRPIWGWGNAWRDHREFVGQIEYGCVYKLWHPELHHRFGGEYRQAVQTLLACQRSRPDCVWSILPDECIYYILNMCRWDWFNDDAQTMKANYRRQKSLLRSGQRQNESETANGGGAAGQGQNGGEGAVVAVDPMEVARNVVIGGAGHDDDDDEEEEEEDDDDDASNESEWERQNGYRADDTNFHFEDVSSDEEDDNDRSAQEARNRQQWFRLNFARIQILRAVAPGRQQDEMNIDT